MIDHHAWASQGDIFAEVPYGLTVAAEGGGIKLPDHPLTPAMLVTYDCQLDKSRHGNPRIQRLHFLPLIAVDSQDLNRQALLRRNEVRPYEAFWLGACPLPIGEAFAQLSEVFSVPAEYFEPVLKPSGLINDVGREELRFGFGANDSRVGTIEDQRLALFSAKWTSYWLGIEPEPIDNLR